MTTQHQRTLATRTHWTTIGLLLVGVAGACGSAGATAGLGSVRVQIEGLVTETGLPAAGVTVEMSVPESGCADARLASTSTDPEVIVTGANGRYSAVLTVRGLSPQTYCVVSRANGARVERPGVPFTAVEAGSMDTTQIDIALP